MIISFATLPDGFDWLRYKGVLLVEKTLPLARRLEIITEHME